MELTETLINEALKNSRGLKYIIAIGKIYTLKKVEHAITMAKRDLNFSIDAANTYEEECDYDASTGEWFPIGVRRPRLELLQLNMSLNEAISQVIKEAMIDTIHKQMMMSMPPICPFTNTYVDDLPF